MSPKKIAILIICLLGLHLILIYKTTLLLTSDASILIRLYILLTGLYLLSRFFVVIFYQDNHDKKYADNRYPSVSFVIAAKNEDDIIYESIANCMKSDYPAPIECIAINDGSTDNTGAEMLRAEKDYSGGVKVIMFEENRGKREAMAEGILIAKGEVIVFVDSDSFVSRDGVKHVVEHFLEDPTVAAVSGNTLIANENQNFLTKMQSARYAISFDIFKACESVFGVVTCCPGCFSAYRRDALMAVLDRWRNQMLWGTRSTFGDDRSLTNYILEDHQVIYCQRGKARTVVPDSYGKFLRQQLRWKKSWVREGLRAATFIWRKNFIAALSFYANLLLPLFSPIIVFYTLLILPLYYRQIPYIFIIGIFALSFLYSLFNYWQTENRYWIYSLPFSLFYLLIMVWQMPYAVYKLRDTTWGTR